MSTSFCSFDALWSACTTSQLHLLSWMSVPTCVPERGREARSPRRGTTQRNDVVRGRKAGPPASAPATTTTTATATARTISTTKTTTASHHRLISIAFPLAYSLTPSLVHSLSSLAPPLIRLLRLSLHIFASHPFPLFSRFFLSLLAFSCTRVPSR